MLHRIKRLTKASTLATTPALASLTAPYAAAQDLDSPTQPLEAVSGTSGNIDNLEVDADTTTLTEEQAASFEAMEGLLNVENTYFDYQRAKSVPSVDPAILNDYAAGLLSQGWEIHASEADLSMLQVQADRISPAMAQVQASCSGQNGFQAVPPAVLLDSCSASAVQNLYVIGAGGAALAALITAETGVGPIIAGTVAALLTASSGLVALCNSWGNGVKIFVTGGCWSQ